VADRPFKVYVIQGRGERDYADCQTALDRVPAQLISLPFIGNADEVIARTRDADALIISSSPVTRRVMESLEGVKAVMRTGVGYDVIDVPAATELGVVVINVPDVWIREVANHALALLLAWNRKIVTLDREVHAGTWGSRVPGPVNGSIHGETVGIVGLGNIGSAFARRIAALETHVIACDPYVDDARFKTLGVERVDLPTLAARADYVSVHALLNAETRGLLNDSFFRRMKPTAILVNTARGPIVDQEALAAALHEGRLGGAGLDVTDPEPLPSDHPLLGAPNLLVVPHIGSATTTARAAMADRAVDNLLAALDGKPMPYPVQPA
jgi:D-3-phosphoglycerate dehydrogenase / 2-oxoglutarate reductase